MYEDWLEPPPVDEEEAELALLDDCPDPPDPVPDPEVSFVEDDPEDFVDAPSPGDPDPSDPEPVEAEARESVL